MSQRTKNTIQEMRIRKADNGYVVITEFHDADIKPKIHISMNIDDVFAVIEKTLV